MAQIPEQRTKQYVRALDRARADLAAELATELEPVRAISATDRGRWVADACATAVAILRSPSRTTSAREHDEPPAASLAEIWQRLMARHRASRR